MDLNTCFLSETSHKDLEEPELGYTTAIAQTWLSMGVATSCNMECSTSCIDKGVHVRTQENFTAHFQPLQRATIDNTVFICSFPVGFCINEEKSVCYQLELGK